MKVGFNIFPTCVAQQKYRNINPNINLGNFVSGFSGIKIPLNENDEAGV